MACPTQFFSPTIQFFQDPPASIFSPVVQKQNQQQTFLFSIKPTTVVSPTSLRKNYCLHFCFEILLQVYERATVFDPILNSTTRLHEKEATKILQLLLSIITSLNYDKMHPTNDGRIAWDPLVSTVTSKDEEDSTANVRRSFNVDDPTANVRCSFSKFDFNVGGAINDIRAFDNTPMMTHRRSNNITCYSI